MDGDVIDGIVKKISLDTVDIARTYLKSEGNFDKPRDTLFFLKGDGNMLDTPIKRYNINDKINV